MLNIIHNGYKKILALFYKNKEQEIHFREIARETKLNENSTSRFLEKLESDKILSSRKDGNLKKYSMTNNLNAYSAYLLFDLERFERFPDVRKNALIYYMNALPEKPVFLLVFGSTAKETFRDDSDIDVLLVMNRRISTEESEKEADASTGMIISTFQITLEDFVKELKLKEDKVVQSALITGFPIMNHVYYYGTLYDQRTRLEKISKRIGRNKSSDR
jgi:predicted nucleotidyltransferase